MARYMEISMYLARKHMARYMEVSMYLTKKLMARLPCNETHGKVHGDFHVPYGYT